jgi:hypothetical protein
MPFAASRIKILKTMTLLGRLVMLVVERERKLPRTFPCGTFAAMGSADKKIRFGARSRDHYCGGLSKGSPFKQLSAQGTSSLN